MKPINRINYYYFRRILAFFQIDKIAFANKADNPMVPADFLRI
jgi:hypothetical protein